MPKSQAEALRQAWERSANAAVAEGYPADELERHAAATGCPLPQPWLARLRAARNVRVMRRVLAALLRAMRRVAGKHGQREEERARPGGQEKTGLGEAFFGLAMILAGAKPAAQHFRRAVQVLVDERLTINGRLEKLARLIAIPPTTSAATLAKALGASKQAVLKTAWWRKQRRGVGRQRAAEREERLRERGRQYERPTDDD